jgi:hypothetical protein
MEILLLQTLTEGREGLLRVRANAAEYPVGVPADPAV